MLMRTILLFVISFFVLSGNRLYAINTFLTDEENEEKIELVGNNLENNEEERSISLRYVEAKLYPMARTVELDLSGIGYVSVVITNSYGEIVSRVSTDTTLPVQLSIPLPDDDGGYIIEIVSSKYYAYGYFNL